MEQILEKRLESALVNDPQQKQQLTDSSRREYEHFVLEGLFNVLIIILYYSLKICACMNDKKKYIYF